MDGIVAGLGTATLASVGVAAANPNKSFVDREVTGVDHRVELTATRRFGTINIGSMPGSVPSPAGFDYLLKLTGYQDSVTSQAGATTTPAPSAPAPSGTVSFWNGSGYTPYAPNDANLNNLTSTVSATNVVGGRVIVVTISVNPGSSAAQTGTNQPLPIGSLLTDVDSSIAPFSATVHYLLTVDGATRVDLTIGLSLGTMITRGVYGQPPVKG